MKAHEILDMIASGIGMKVSEIPDGGFFNGDDDTEVKGILVCWWSSREALQTATENGLNLVISHEPPYFIERNEVEPYRMPGPYPEPKNWAAHPNRKLHNIIKSDNLTVLQIHYGLDRFCIYQDFLNFLGITETVSGNIYEKIFRLPQPMKLKDLAEAIRQKLNMPRLRYIGDPDKIVEKIGNCWGGVSLISNQYFLRRQAELGADAIIGGESDEIAMLFVESCDIGLIETGHALSENIGLSNFADILQEAYPDIPVQFYSTTPSINICR